MNGFIDDIQERTKHNHDFRHVLYTGPNAQLVAMCLEPGEEIGEEVHEDTDQFFRIETGKGEIVMDGLTRRVNDDIAIVVPAGMRHSIRNTGRGPLRLYTLYAPPHHADGTVHRTKAEAELAEFKHQ